MMKNRRGDVARRVSSIVGAAALVLAGVLGATGPASAAPSNVPTADGSLTIHKYEQPNPAGGANDTGAPIASVPATWNAIENVNFTYQRIDVDLSDSAGWAAVDGYVSSPATAPLTGAAGTVTTGADGSAVIANLPVGAYLVTEVSSPNALRDGEPVTITQMAAPFVVTVPVPTGNGTWNSDVHVYPKNSITTVGKVAGAPSGAGVGSTIPWTITVQVPALPGGQTYSDFRVTDQLDSKLAYAATSSVTLDGVAIGHTVNNGAQPIGWVISDLAALNAAQGKNLVISFTTTVLTAGAIENTADVWINDPGMTGSPITTPAATTYWGGVEVLKHVTGDVTKVLAGAQFAIYATEAEAAAGTASGRIAVTRDSSGASIPAQTVFETTDTGKVLIPGLFAGNNSDTAPISRTYYLREIKAPAGYELSATPITVVVTADGVTTPVEVAVPNPQLPPFKLPLTGGDGTLMLTAAGAGLLLSAAGVALFGVRRRRHAASVDA